jgi:hypothetical protein
VIHTSRLSLPRELERHRFVPGSMVVLLAQLGGWLSAQ